MSDKHFVGKVALKAIIVRDGRVLLGRGPQDGETWDIPGGRIHENEFPKDALRREIQEELGVDAAIGNVVHIEQFHQTSDGSLHLCISFEVTLTDPEATLTFPSGELNEVRWITKEQLYDQKMYGNLLKALEVYWN